MKFEIAAKHAISQTYNWSVRRCCSFRSSYIRVVSHEWKEEEKTFEFTWKLISWTYNITPLVSMIIECAS